MTDEEIDALYEYQRKRLDDPFVKLRIAILEFWALFKAPIEAPVIKLVDWLSRRLP